MALLIEMSSEENMIVPFSGSIVVGPVNAGSAGLIIENWTYPHGLGLSESKSNSVSYKN